MPRGCSLPQSKVKCVGSEMNFPACWLITCARIAIMFETQYNRQNFACFAPQAVLKLKAKELSED